MLTDHRKKQAEWAKAALCRYRDTSAMGDMVAQLAPWSWWATFTFRRMPSRSWALAQVRRYLEQLEIAAAQPIESVFLEDFGDLGGRYHFHLLIAGVDHLSSDGWEREARRLFGDCKIKPYDAEQGAAHYVAGKAVSKDRDLHFYGELRKKADAGDSATRVSSVVRGSPARQNAPDRERGKEDNPDVHVEKAVPRIFVSGSATAGTGRAAFAWFNETTGHKRVKSLTCKNAIEAEYHGLISVLETIPENEEAEILCASLLVYAQFDQLIRVVSHSQARLLAGVRALIRQRRLEVTLRCIPRSQNRGWILLRNFRRSGQV